ncbi:MAG TPA: tetratricopeptide repeat protein [Steroidobacter sp.]|uniref:tetratricopeptide repeat protein n=1 Tax=Steroidobacter sp. TaxID=1978227 RepID=UPI002EDA136D
MDIWEWVYQTCDDLREAGHERLAFIVDELPGLICGDQQLEAEALIPEGLALARSIDHPWLEVYLRHWLAQSRVVRRRDVTGGLEELIHLLDFAHGERTAACPQSVCVTQDVCIAYGAVDGPGYAEERLAASAETIERIDVTWPCFQCISAEHAAALLDAGLYQDAESYCRTQLEKASTAGQGTLWQVKWHLVDALARQGRHEEALALLDPEGCRGMDEEESRRHSLHHARELAVAGKLDEAVSIQMQPLGLKPSEYILWLRAEIAFCERVPERNDFQLGKTLRRLFTTLRDHGALYEQAEIGMAAAKLALARGSSVVATMYWEEVEAVVPRLRRPQRIIEELETQRRSLAPKAAAPMAESSLIDALTDNPERNLELLQQATTEAASSEAILLARCEAYREAGFSNRAKSELEEFVARYPESVPALDQLLRVLLAAVDEAAMRSLVQKIDEARRPRALFYQARLYQGQRRWQEAAAALEVARRLEPDVPVLASELAVVYRHLERYEEALTILDELVASEPEAGDVDWERMVVATALGRFDEVRHSARRLEFDFAGEGPIDQPYAYCDILLKDAAGREVPHRAERISPVVARILQMQAPAVPSVFRDEILFDPVSLNPPPEQGSDERPILRFRPIKQLRAGGYRVYDIDGVHPGDESVEGLRAALRELGVVLSIRSSEEYQIEVDPEQEPVRGLYAFLAVPGEVTSAEVLACVQSCTTNWLGPMTYRGLLKELGMAEQLARQEQWADQVQL